MSCRTSISTSSSPGKTFATGRNKGRLHSAIAHAGLGRLHSLWRPTSVLSRPRAKRSDSLAPGLSMHSPSRVTRWSSSAYQFQVDSCRSLHWVAAPGDLARCRRNIVCSFPCVRFSQPIATRRVPFQLKLALSPLAQGDSLSQGRGSCIALDAHFKGRPGSDRCALLCEKSRSCELPIRRCRRARNCGRRP